MPSLSLGGTEHIFSCREFLSAVYNVRTIIFVLVIF